MKNILILFITFKSILVLSQNIEINILKEFTINSISSASGIEIINGTTYIVSDDQPNIFFTNDYKKINKTKIIDFNEIRIEKLYKPDFEALGKIEINNKDFLLIISSGSRINYRDTIFLFNPYSKEIISKRNFREIYNKMYINAKLSEWASINIEAVVSNKTYIYMFQRGNIDGNNVIFRFNKVDFFQYLVGKRNSLDFVFKKFKLPIYENTKAGFSGACFLNEDEIIFTASLETSPTAYADGEILGSYIGILNYENANIDYKLIKKDKDILITKLESCCIITKTSDNDLTLLLSSDNDNGISEFYEIKLIRKNGSN